MDFERSPTYTALPDHAKPAWLRAVGALPPAWLIAPATGEVFEGKDNCYQRLQAWALLQGFAVVQGRVWKDGTPRWQFICKAHGTKTENKRNLESRKRKDEEGKVVSDRQRDTMIKAKKDCEFEYLLSHKPVSRGSKDKEYIGTLKCLNHTHPLHLNPFSFKVHEKSTVEYQALVAQARKYRIGKRSYAESQELLEQELLGMTISQKTYYNLLRKKPGDSSDPGTIDGLLAVLNEASFTFRCRTKDEMEGDRVIKRKLIQIVFFHKEAIRFGQRFIAGKVLVVDGTCNTNKLRMPLLIGVGITNSNKTFPLAYSYCPGETAESYDFFFEILGEEVFFDDILDPAVVMGDQAAGLIKAVDVLDSIPNGVLQFCNWHAVEAMRAKFNKAGYTTEDIDGYTEGQAPDEVEIPGLTDLSWAYIKSDTLEELDTNRAALVAALRPKEKGYIIDTWFPKEKRVIFCYTKLLNNLGCVATQRSESYHPSIKKVTNGQLSLEDAVAAISNKTLAIYKQLSMDEDRALIDADLALDTSAFKYLINAVSIIAIRLIETEWITLHELTQAVTEISYHLWSGDHTRTFYTPHR
jgi:hypothetical protein